MKKSLLIMLLLGMTVMVGSCGTTGEKADKNSEAASDVNVEVVEITEDNWQDYLEYTELNYIEYNDFDEVEDIWPAFTLCLKDGYAIPTDEEIEATYGPVDYDNAITVDYSIKYAIYEVDIDLENEKIKYLRSAEEVYTDAGESYSPEWYEGLDESGIATLNLADSEKWPLSAQQSETSMPDKEGTIWGRYKYDESTFTVNRIEGTLLLKQIEE